MNERQPHPNLSRRDLLKLLAVAGAATAGGYALFEYTPWLDYEQPAEKIRMPLEKSSSVPTQMRGLVRYATLAASGHNTQPWKFAIQTDAIEIHPDYSRRLPVVDPGDRELWISLGCSLENLLHAARAAGYAPDVTYPDTAEFIRVRLVADAAQGGPLLDAIPLRQNTRSEYDARSVNARDLDQLHALSLEPGVKLWFALNAADINLVLDYVNQSNLSQYADGAFLDELIDWIRFNKKEALASLDGLFSRCSGSPEVPRWLGQMVVAGTNPQQQADVDARKLRSSAGAVVIISESDDRAAWVRTGQVYERLALTLTSMNIKSAFLNQPIEVGSVRGQFQNAIGLDTAVPQLLVRFGYAGAMPRSQRRSVESVLV